MADKDSHSMREALQHLPYGRQLLHPVLLSLQKLLPPIGVLIVGGGSRDWVQWSLDATRNGFVGPITFVEVDPLISRSLRAQFLGTSVVVKEGLVAGKSGPIDFYRMSNSRESSLLTAAQLEALWPNTSLVSIQRAVGSTLDQVADNNGRQDEKVTWLVIDCLPSPRLLKGGKTVLENIDVVVLRLAEGLPENAFAGARAADQLLDPMGFVSVHLEPERNPKIGVAVYVRDIASDLGKARAEAVEVKKTLRRCERKLRKRELTSALTRYQEKLAIEEHADRFQRTIDDQLSAVRSALAQVERTVEKACETRFRDANNLVETLKSGAASLEAAFLRSELKITGGVSKEIKNATRQIEAFAAVHNFFATGQLTLDFHGWPISPDLAALLIKKICTERYDIIVEFGSGTSSVLIAKTLKLLQAQDRSSARPQFLSFEHDAAYQEQTKKLLLKHQVADFAQVDLVKLKSWQDETGDYLFYDCAPALSEVRVTAGGPTSKNILVLVDGPPGVTCRNARYPAVPIIFAHFGSDCIEVILDDADRKEESNIITLWRKYWNERKVEMHDLLIDSEKGIYTAKSKTTAT